MVDVSLVRNTRQIIDAGAEAATVTSGRLDVNAVVDTSLLATAAKQDSLLTELQLKADLTETQPVSLVSVPSHNVTNTGTFAVQATGTVTANAGTNLNTSSLALETGGNLATIAGKDFATQTTLALIKAKTDNLDVALSTRTKPADTQTISGAVSVTGSVTANAGTNLNTSSLALETGGNLATIKTNTDNLPAGTTIYNGQTTVTTAGVRVVLGASTTIKWVIVKAKITNTGNIFIGNSTVTSANGYILTPGEAAPLDINNLNLSYIDSTVNGEGVSYIARN